MDKLARLALVLAVALGLASCSYAQPNENAGQIGSVGQIGSAGSNASTDRRADFVYLGNDDAQDETASFDLARDNPFADETIVSVVMHVYGVGEIELEGQYLDALLAIIQNDARVWQDRSAWMSIEDWAYTVTQNENPPRFSVTLESGELFYVKAYEAAGALTNILTIDDEEYDLTAEEYAVFEELYLAARDKVFAEADDVVRPYADLTIDDLEKVTRVRHYMDFNPDEQVLTESQLELVLDALNNLEIETAAVDFTPEILAGGGYAHFELWFKDGEHYAIGEYGDYFDYDSGERTQDSETYPVAYIDGILYRCNSDYAYDMYWNYEETAEGYVKRYFSGRDIPEYPFERLTADEITGIGAGALVTSAWDDMLGPSAWGIEETSTYWGQNTVPLSLAEDVVDIMRQIRYADDNTLERPDLSFDESVQISSQLVVTINGTENIDLGVYEGHLVMNQSHFTEDAELIDALEDLIALAKEKSEELLALQNERQTVKFFDEETVKVTSNPNVQFPSAEAEQEMQYCMSFELPAALVEHDDGYYPEGYTLDDAPIYVTVSEIDPVMNGKAPAGSNLKRLLDAMEDDVTGSYKDTRFQCKKGHYLRFVKYTGSDPYDREYLFVSSGYATLEIDVVSRGEYVIDADAIYRMLSDTFATGYEAVGDR